MSSQVLTPRREAGWSVVDLDGEIDVSTRTDLRDCLTEVIARHGRPPRVIVDMSRVTFCDASGLGVLIGAHGRIRQQHGLFRVVCPEGKAMRVIRLTRTTHMLPIHPTLHDALTAPVDPDPVGG